MVLLKSGLSNLMQSRLIRFSNRKPRKVFIEHPNKQLQLLVIQQLLSSTHITCPDKLIVYYLVFLFRWLLPEFGFVGFHKLK